MAKTLLFLLIILLSTTPVHPSGWKLAWDLPSDPNIIGVRMYYGEVPDTLLQEGHSYDAGYTEILPMSYLFMEGGVVYWFGCTAYSSDRESVLSNLVSFDNYYQGNGWNRIESQEYLGDYEMLDFNGNGILNRDDPDINGNGILNIYDDYPLFNKRLGYVDHVYTIESGNRVFVGLTTFEVSQQPVAKSFNRDQSGQRNIQFGCSDYYPIKIENLGNLDNAGGDEMAVTLWNKSSGIEVVEIRDIITGTLYTGEVTPPPPTISHLEILEHLYFHNESGDLFLALLGFCSDDQRTTVRIVNPSTKVIVKSFLFLEIGERPLAMDAYTTDDSTYIAVAGILASGQIEIKNIAE